MPPPAVFPTDVAELSSATDYMDGDEYGLLVATLSKGKTSELRVSINEYKGHRYIDIREFFQVDGVPRPTKRGITLSVDRYLELLEAVVELGEVLGYSHE